MQIIDGDQKDDFPLWDVHILFFKKLPGRDLNSGPLEKKNFKRSL